MNRPTRSDPKSPAFQHKFAHLQSRYNEGDKQALIEALFLCANHNCGWPDWVQEQVEHAIYQWVIKGEISIEAALTGKSKDPRKALRTRWREESIYFLVKGIQAGRREAKLKFSDYQLSDSIDAVAKMLGMKYGTVEDDYKNVQRRVREGITPVIARDWSNAAKQKITRKKSLDHLTRDK